MKHIIFIVGLSFSFFAHVADPGSFKASSLYRESFVVNGIKIACQYLPNTDLSLCHDDDRFFGVIYWHKNKQAPFIPCLFYDHKFFIDIEVKAFAAYDKKEANAEKFTFSPKNFIIYYNELASHLEENLPALMDTGANYSSLAQFFTDLDLLIIYLNEKNTSKISKLSIQKIVHENGLLESQINSYACIDVSTKKSLRAKGRALAYLNLNQIDPATESFLTELQMDDGEPLSLKEAQEVLQMILGMNDLAFDIYHDGCYARADLMTKRVEQKGYNIGKMWLKSNNLKCPRDSTITWYYHVLPALLVNINGKAEYMFADPVLDNTKLLTLKELLSLLNLEGNFKRVYYPLPREPLSDDEVMLCLSSALPLYPYRNFDNKAKSRYNKDFAVEELNELIKETTNM